MHNVWKPQGACSSKATAEIKDVCVATVIAWNRCGWAGLGVRRGPAHAREIERSGVCKSSEHNVFGQTRNTQQQ